VALVERVHVAAARGARRASKSWLLRPVPIASIAIRCAPSLADDRRADHRHSRGEYRRLRHVSPSLASAAVARGWMVHWYDREHVFRDAAAVVSRKDVNAFRPRWGDRSGRRGRLITSLRQPRRSSQRWSDNEYELSQRGDLTISDSGYLPAWDAVSISCEKLWPN
jgi:hypothetical protein